MGLSTIQWTDYTENFWLGCSFAKTAAGAWIPECFNCYAKLLDDNRYSKTLNGGSKEHPITHWGDTAPRHRTSEANWRNPFVWNRKAICTACGFAEWIGSDDCRKCGRNFSAENRRRPRVFTLSLGDWLDEKVPIEWLADMLDVIRRTPNLDWLMLTKRPQNWRPRMEAAMEWLIEHDEDARELREWMAHWTTTGGKNPHNVWIGVSAGADQKAALDIPARVHFLSCEPMLRPMDAKHARLFNWIILGGESGSKARPCAVEWIREGVKFCHENNIAPFVKQMGSNLTACILNRPFIGEATDEPGIFRVTLKDSHGGDMDEWPEDLRVREFPAPSPTTPATPETVP